MSGAGEEEPPSGDGTEPGPAFPPPEPEGAAPPGPAFFVTDQPEPAAQWEAPPPAAPPPAAPAPPGPSLSAGTRPYPLGGPFDDLRESWFRRVWRRLRPRPPGPI
jgi:hypothetical protein